MGSLKENIVYGRLEANDERKCPFNALQIYHMCYMNSVQVHMLSMYTSFRDQIAMGPFDCEHIPCDCRDR